MVLQAENCKFRFDALPRVKGQILSELGLHMFLSVKQISGEKQMGLPKHSQKSLSLHEKNLY